MAATQNTPPGVRPCAAAQLRWSGEDLGRSKAHFNVPEMGDMPDNFFGPSGPSDPNGLARDFRYQRLLTAVRMHHPSKLLAVTRGMFALIWTKPRNDGDVLITEEVLAAVCVEAGLTADEAIKMVGCIQSADTKSLLRSTVSEAVERGAFGAPT